MKNQFALGLNDLTARKIVLEKILKYRQIRKPLSLNDLVEKLSIREIAINSINKAEELKKIKMTPKVEKTVRINEDREISREVPFSTEWADDSVAREQNTESYNRTIEKIIIIITVILIIIIIMIIIIMNMSIGKTDITDQGVG